ncbi:hypothetical protein AVEN_88611-2 [Araneus ventricosus]|uniref:Uncharacterized protein n=1 Tax=Araneus ventricosus TaxID=182803 RepID=A0A4Y2FNH2_ARAVE|nr:hypothetical protein AVEN_88611-2 [Araneus ventricosus]
MSRLTAIPSGGQIFQPTEKALTFCSLHAKTFLNLQVVIKNPDTDFTFIRIPPSGVDPGASTMQRIQHFNSTTSYKQRFYHRAFRRPTRMKEEEKKSGLTVHRKLIMISTNFHQRF